MIVLDEREPARFALEVPGGVVEKVERGDLAVLSAEGDERIFAEGRRQISNVESCHEVKFHLASDRHLDR